jgi:hypothetical protein
MKRIVLALALAFVPSAALAQHHEHSKPTTAKPAAHSNFARDLIAAKTDLKLTAAQITRLEAVAVRMDEMHKHPAQHAEHAKSKEDHGQSEEKLHADLMSIFSEEQLVKVRPLMKAHMEKCEHMKGARKNEHKH